MEGLKINILAPVYNRAIKHSIHDSINKGTFLPSTIPKVT